MPSGLLPYSDKIENILAINSGRNDGSLKVGDLGNFYSCTSIDDSAPTLVAHGSVILQDIRVAEAQCRAFAVSILNAVDTEPDGDINYYTDGPSSVFVSFSEMADTCFEIRSGSDGSVTSTAFIAETLCLYALDHVVS